MIVTSSIPSLAVDLQERFGAAISISRGAADDVSILLLDITALPLLSKYLFWEADCLFGGLIVEQRKAEWLLRYLFLLRGKGWIHVILSVAAGTGVVPSISSMVHAADWYEREAEDLFGLQFEGHPRLGDFILHDQVWQEGLTPMRTAFDVRCMGFEEQPNQDWKPLLVVEDPGAFAMPIGPVYEGGLGESAHFLLETIGEDIIRALPRLFYKYRAVEKLAEGKTILGGLLLAERFAAKSAFAHSLAYCHAVENLANIEVPARAMHLRIALGELERLRHHAGSIEAICRSTALNVSEAHAAIVEERLLRASCCFSGHRYLFGLNVPGGLRRDFDEAGCAALLQAVDVAVRELRRLEDRLRYTSSFLDRLENVGNIDTASARDFDLAGPVGRASGLANDLRKIYSYGGYREYRFSAASENEGDGYARLRILFSEVRQSAELIHQVMQSLQPGEVLRTVEGVPANTAMGWTEAPIGGTIHWLRIAETGRIERYAILTPSFRNWLGFHAAVENFAFQDFPIILATFGLSAAECDR